MAERRVLSISQSIVEGEPLDTEGHVFFTEIISRLSGAELDRAGASLKMPAQADSTAATVAEMVTDFNLLLARLRSAGYLDT